MPHRFLLPPVPCLKMLSKIILTTFAAGITSSLIYLIYLYHSLSLKIHHSHFVGYLPTSLLSSSLEAHQGKTSDESKSVPNTSVPDIGVPDIGIPDLGVPDEA
jgi:hypothetical protein